MEQVKSLGIDQGLANIGFSVCLIRDDFDETILESGVITTDSSKSLQSRISEVYDRLNRILTEHQDIKIIGTENLFFNNAMSGGRNKSAAIVQTNMVTGVIALLSAQHDTIFKQYTPGVIKKYITGNAKADKDEVIQGITRIVEQNNIDIIADHHSDAIALSVAAGTELFCKGEGFIEEEKEKKKSANISFAEKNAFYRESISKTVANDRSYKKNIEKAFIELENTKPNLSISNKKVVGKFPFYVSEIVNNEYIVSINSSVNKTCEGNVIFEESGNWCIGKFKSKVCSTALLKSIEKVKAYIVKNEYVAENYVLIKPLCEDFNDKCKYEIWIKAKPKA